MIDFIKLLRNHVCPLTTDDLIHHICSTSKIGAVLVAADGKVLGRGHNMRVQSGNPILHVSTVSGKRSNHTTDYLSLYRITSKGWLVSRMDLSSHMNELPNQT